MTEDNILDTYVKHTQPGQVFTGWKVFFGPAEQYCYQKISKRNEKSIHFSFIKWYGTCFLV